MMADEAILLATSAEVLFHDGATWVRLVELGSNSSGLATVQLVRTAQDANYRIVAIRRLDNKRIVDQMIFHRLKYKEATPSFHQWRNEHKQVIGLNFSNEQEARHFYVAVRQALESVNLQPQPYSSTQKSHTDNGTYQDPQNFHNNYGQLHQDILYANNDNPYMDGGVKSNGYMDISSAQKLGKCSIPPSNQQQQQNLMRRASQGSNISSSTGGSLPGPNQRQALVTPQQNNYNTNEIDNYAHHPNYPPTQQFEQINGNGTLHHQNISNSSCMNAVSHQADSSTSNVPKAPMATAPPPPPPPPPPELKNALSASKQQSFADQLRHIQLRKNSTATEKSSQKPSPSSNPRESTTTQLNGQTTKMQSGNQDLISELADRLNKRKMNIEAESGGGPSSNTPQQQKPSVTANPLKNAQPSTSHKKIPSGCSLSSQDSAANGVGGSNNINNQMAGGSERNGSTGTLVTTDDLAQLKSELTEAFSEELSRLKEEMTQTIRSEIAKLISQK